MVCKVSKGRPGQHQWRRKKVLLPSEQILHSVRLSQRLEREAREEVQSRQREEVDLELVECPSPRFRNPKNAVAKFLTSACLPRTYAESWRRMNERPKKSLPPAVTPRLDWDNACCVVEASSRLSVHWNHEKVEKVPPRTWLLLEPPSDEDRAIHSSDQLNDFKELVHFVTKKNTCLLSTSAGGGWLEDQPGISLLRPVPESRLHCAAAEANFQRASGGSSVLALRHAAVALELLRTRQPPEKNWINKPVGFVIPEAKESGAVLPLVPLKGGVLRPRSPEEAPPWPQFVQALEDRPDSRWAESPSDARTLSPRPTTRGTSVGSRAMSTTPRPGTGESAARSARVEALVTSRVLVAERCAESARQWQESCYKKDLDTEEEERRFPHGQSVMQKGFHALMEFLDFTNRRYGNPARTWFKLDAEANMRLGKRQFERRCMDIGFRGNIPALWKYMDKRNQGVVSLLELHTVTAMELARFKLLIRERFRDNASEVFRFLDDNRSGRVNRVTFAARLQTLHYAGKSNKLFDYLDRQGLGVLTVHSLTFLDRWSLPPYMYYQPDTKGMRTVKEKLIDMHMHPLIAWRKIDKDGSMRISYDEFRFYLYDMLSANKAMCVATSSFPKTEPDIAAVWRAMDKECTGYIELRDWDIKSHEHLAEFKTWADRTHGSATAAFRALDTGASGQTSNCKLSRKELERCTKGEDSCKAEIEFLFDGLDVNQIDYLYEADVKFLDGWDLAWEEWQAEAEKKWSEQG